MSTVDERTHLLELIDEMPEKRLIEVRDFVLQLLLENDEDRLLRQASIPMSRRALAEAWENEEDATYDGLPVRGAVAVEAPLQPGEQPPCVARVADRGEAATGEGAMGAVNLLNRIVIDARVMVGKPVIRGTRLTVPYILGLLAAGTTHQDIVSEYQGLTEEDIRACLAYASKALDSPSTIPLSTDTS